MSKQYELENSRGEKISLTDCELKDLGIAVGLFCKGDYNVATFGRETVYGCVRIREFDPAQTRRSA